MWRADVLNLLRHGIKNVISLGGNKVPKEIIDLSRQKTVTLFVDGDRGGDLIIKELLMVAEIDFVAKAPDGKEVEELTKKEIHKALRGKEPAEQVRENLGVSLESSSRSRSSRPEPRKAARTEKRELSEEEREQFSKLLDDLVGTRGAYLLKDSEILGKVPTVELGRYLEILKADTIVMDGEVDRKIVSICKSHGVGRIVATSSDSGLKGVEIITKNELKGGKK